MDDHLSDVVPTVSKIDLFSLAKTPINLSNLNKELEGYDSQKAAAISMGFTCGFPLHYSGIRSPLDSKNLKSALDQPSVVREKIQAEIEAGRVAGPFSFSTNA